MGRGGSRITSKRTHLKVGSSEGTANLTPMPPVTRKQVEADRAQFTSGTIADALAERASGLSDAQVPSFVENMQGALLEAQKGDRRALDTYSLAMNKLFIQNPLRWQSIQVASGMDMPTFARQFAPQKASGELAQANAALGPAQDIPPEQVAGVATKMVDDLAYGRGQEMGAELAVDPRVGGNLAAQPMPVNPPADPTRADAEWRWADFLGGAKPAEKAYFDNTRSDTARQLFPQLAAVENIRALAKMSGLPFHPVVGPNRAGPLHPAVADAMDLLERNASYDFEKKSQLRPQIEQEVLAEAVADPDLPEQTRAAAYELDPQLVGPPSGRADQLARAVALRSQDRMDAMPVATYPDDLQNKVRELLAQRLSQEPDALPPQDFSPTIADPNARQAELDAMAEQLPDEYMDPSFVGPLQPQPEVSVPDLASDPNAPPAWQSPELDLPEGAQRVNNALDMMNFGIRVPGTTDPASIVKERDFINQARTPLEKALEENQMIMEGRGYPPDVVARLLGKVRGVDPDVQSLASANRGALYDLDNRVKFWRQGIRIQDPTTGEIRVVPFPPDVLAGLHAQAMGITDPNIVARMIDPMANSIDVYSHLQPTGAAKSLLDSLSQPGAPEPPPANISRQLLEALGRDVERRQGKKTPVLFTRPKPPTPDMTDTSMMPMTDRFAASRMNPLTALIG